MGMRTLTAAAALAGLALLIHCGGTPGSPSGAATPPNIVLLLADDMGYADPSAFGGTAVQTPHLDALAASGIKLTNFYAASAVCSPSRAAILTGRYPNVHGAGVYADSGGNLRDDVPPALAEGVPTLPERLRAHGYRVCTAEDGRRAGKIMAEQSREIALVLLDAVMPGERGEDVLELLRAHRHDVPVLLMSGFLGIVRVRFPSYKRFRSRFGQILFYGSIVGGLTLLVLGGPGGTVLLALMLLYVTRGLIVAATHRVRVSQDPTPL